MDWNYIFLGLIQGVTEFLPVSSSGHLFLLEQILGDNKTELSFVLLIHTATLLSVLVVFFKDIKSFIFGLKSGENFQLFLKILISLVPLIFIGLLFRSFVQQSFEKHTVAFGFLSSGLILSSLFFVKKQNLSLEKMNFFQAFLIGLSQAIAVFPGFSRAALTISMGLYCGLAPRAAVYYSFLISLPAIAGSSLVDLILHLSKDSSGEDSNLLLSAETGLSLTLAFFTAFFIGLLSLLLVLKLVQSEKLYIFSIYLLPLSLLVFFLL